MLNGLEVLEALRQDRPETPVIGLTGQRAVEPLLRAGAAGSYDFLEKPVQVPQLGTLVAKALTPEIGDRRVTPEWGWHPAAPEHNQTRSSPKGGPT